uniref:Uncharacterized protein n=1 Tax=Romanomermis culicivorax TaxID=13658 RepID=A0A915KXK6_ROMCU
MHSSNQGMGRRPEIHSNHNTFCNLENKSSHDRASLVQSLAVSTDKLKCNEVNFINYGSPPSSISESLSVAKLEGSQSSNCRINELLPTVVPPTTKIIYSCN